MNLRQLEIFCKIVELKSFSRAARAVYLSQPTLTEHIKSLEEYFGIKLLDRLGREVLPTRPGEILYQYAQKLMNLMEETKQALDNFKGEMRGNVMVGASTIPGEYILPSMIMKFNELFPGISLDLKIGDTRGIISDIIDNRLELGIVGAKSGKPQTGIS